MLERDIKEYFKEIFNNNLNKLLEFSEMQLTFSFLLGLCPKECEGMYPEEEWTSDQLREYDEVEGIITKWKRQLRK